MIKEEQMIWVKVEKEHLDLFPEGRTCPHVNTFDERNIIDQDVLVTPLEEIEITFDYPLARGHEVTLKFQNKGGFTRRAFLCAVRDGYQQIYREEHEAVYGNPEAEAPCINGTANRCRTEGPHGIWGHGINDLYFEGYEEKKPGKFELIIGS